MGVHASFWRAHTFAMLTCTCCHAHTGNYKLASLLGSSRRTASQLGILSSRAFPIHSPHQTTHVSYMGKDVISRCMPATDYAGRAYRASEAQPSALPVSPAAICCAGVSCSLALTGACSAAPRTDPPPQRLSTSCDACLQTCKWTGRSVACQTPQAALR